MVINGHEQGYKRCNCILSCIIKYILVQRDHYCAIAHATLLKAFAG